jgi:effector-binding domain-containing protein
MKQILSLLPLTFVTVFVFSSAATQKQNSSSHFKPNYPTQDSVPVKIQLEQTTMNDMTILFIPDTAKTNEAIEGVFSKDYGELMQYIQQNKLQPFKFIAWYYTAKAPWLMDVAVEITQAPAELSGRIQSRTQKGGEVLIAHMWGPYDQVGQAYTQIQTWLKENKREAREAPFEVYINDPSAVKDASEIQTDIYQPIE